MHVRASVKIAMRRQAHERNRRQWMLGADLRLTPAQRKLRRQQALAARRIPAQRDGSS